jgi:membrane-associated phospholipid phosphatase
MTIESSKSRELPPAGELSTSEYRDHAGGRGEPIAAAAAALDQRTGLRAAAIVALGVYLSALGGSALLHVRATILDAVPLSLAAAIFLRLYSRHFSRRILLLVGAAEAGSLVVAFGLSLACLSYIGAIAALPLRDAEIIFIDRQLGFDWLRFMNSLDRWPVLLRVLNAAYATFTAQLVVTVLVLVLAERRRDLDRFFITFACASIIAETASFLVPTLGPMAILADHINFANLPTVGRATAEIVLALRHGVLRAIDFDALDGIISFPSLHAAAAVIVPYTLRWSKLLFWPSLAVDILMLSSTVPIGNHYLTDVLSGLVVAVFAISSGRYIHAAVELFLDKLT